MHLKITHDINNEILEKSVFITETHSDMLQWLVEHPLAVVIGQLDN